MCAHVCVCVGLGGQRQRRSNVKGETIDCCGIWRMQETGSNSAQGQMKQSERNFFTCLTHRC